MSLPPGTRLGEYEIVSRLGAGGMGEVYRAFDRRLRREVAVKVLPDSVVRDPSRRVRFEREARLLAQLHHPHVASIFGLEGGEERLALILELVEGPTLADRIAEGPIAPGEAIALARQLAEALEAAHAKGIIHRDLKPQNIKLSAEGAIKVLDFGLAKAFDPKSGSPADGSAFADSPTITLHETLEGVILGTAAYMAPEQAKGLEVGRQADIWAFGVVLWEMLTGARLFAAPSVSETLSAVLSAGIDFERLPADTPPAIRRLVRRCLERDPRHRLHDMADVRIVLADEQAGRGAGAEATPATASPGQSSSPTRRAVVALRVLGALSLALAGLAVALWRRPAPPDRPLRGRFEIPLPPGEQLDAFYRRAVALSPDGRTLAVVTSAAAEPPAPPTSTGRRIELRALDGDLFRPVPGSEGALDVAFSPDGRWLAFFVFTGFVSPEAPYSELRKVPVEGGRPVKICSCRGGWGLSWGESGTLAFGGWTDPIWGVDAGGGDAAPLAALDEASTESGLAHPVLLPDGRTLLFAAQAVYPGSSSKFHLYAQRLDGGERRLLVNAATDPRFAPPDRLYFVRDGTIYASSLDLAALRLRGEPQPVVEGVAHALATGWEGSDSGIAQYDVSASGLLVYGPGSIAGERLSEVTWAEPAGRLTPLDLPPADRLAVRIEPGGERILLSSSYPGRQVELLDPERGTLRPVTFGVEPQFAIWGPGPQEITFSSTHEGHFGLYSRALDAPAGPPVALLREAFSYIAASAWSSDGRTLYFSARAPRDDSGGLYVVEPPAPPRPLFESPYSFTHPEPSPNSRWLAYASDEAERTEVWVRPLGRVGAPLQVSVAGGTEPAWSRDGRSLLYAAEVSAGERAYFRVAAEERDGGLRLGLPEKLLTGNFRASIPTRSYDVAADGRLLLIAPISRSEAERAAAAERLFPKRLHVVLGASQPDAAGGRR